MFLKAENVTITFGGVNANQNVNVEFEKGQIVGLIGPNGAGKSTFFKAVIGFNTVASGHIYFKGEEITNQDPYKICRKGISTTFQKAQAFPQMTLEESVRVGAYCHIKNKKEDVKYIVMDAGYKTPAIARVIIEDGKVPVMPYTRPMTKDGFFKKYEYVYDEYYDCYICPENQILRYSTTNREGYREYKSTVMICENCVSRYRCTESQNHTKIVTRHIWEPYMEQVEDYRHTRGIKNIYQQRKETIERVFADAKEKHGMRYTQYRGLAKVKMELPLLFGCMNLKKMANWKWKNRHLSLFYSNILQYFIKNKEKWLRSLCFKTTLSTV